MTNQIALYSGLAVDRQAGPLSGVPSIETNAGVITYSLGYRAAHDLLSGHWPLWNPYEGLGAPLLGEMQSAALFPPSLLLALPRGKTLEECFLQFLGGLGAYLFFRTFGIGRRAAFAGGIAWEVNGVFTWLRNSIFNPVAFLPWLFLAIELMRAAAIDERPLKERLGGVYLGAIAATLAIASGFPEEVYLYSVLLILWCAVRFIGLSRPQALRLAAHLALAGILAGALSAPVIVPFANFLPEAFSPRHEGQGFYGIWLQTSALLQYLMPYVFGPVFGTGYPPIAGGLFGSTGGFLGLAALPLALGALFSPGNRPVKIALGAWVFVAVGVTHGFPVVYQVFMMLPLVKITAAFRYLNASWIFCMIFLAVLFLDQAAKIPRAALRGTMALAVAVGLLATAAAAAGSWPVLVAYVGIPHGPMFITAAAVAALGILGALALAPWVLSQQRATTALSAVLVAEALAWYFFPYFSHPRRVEMDYSPVAFLQEHAGFQRFMNAPLFGLEPNYGSVYGVSQLNYVDLPVPARTVDYLRRELYADATEVFLLHAPDAGPEELQARVRTFHERLPKYAQAGVKYVLGPANFGEGDPNLTPVFHGRRITVFEVASPRNYFSAQGCSIEARSRTDADVTCEGPSKLVRLELFMKDWSARVNNAPATITPEEEAFQAVDLPAGKSHVTFTYWPAGFGAALASAGLALALMAAWLVSWRASLRSRTH